MRSITRTWSTCTPTSAVWAWSFREPPHPVYWDFVYFSFTNGMAFATSDVVVTETRMRKTVIIHGFAAFAFNIGVLAFTINVLGSSG